MSWINMPTPSFENFRKMKPTQVLILLIAFVIFILIAIEANHTLVLAIFWFLVLVLCGHFINKNEEEEEQRREEQEQKSTNLKNQCAPQLEYAISEYKKFHCEYGYPPDDFNRDEMQNLISALLCVFHKCEINNDEPGYRKAIANPFVLACTLLPCVESGDMLQVRREIKSFS